MGSTDLSLVFAMDIVTARLAKIILPVTIKYFNLPGTLKAHPAEYKPNRNIKGVNKYLKNRAKICSWKTCYRTLHHEVEIHKVP